MSPPCPSFETLLATFTPPRIAPLGVRTEAASVPSLSPHTWSALVGDIPAPTARAAGRGQPDRTVPVARSGPSTRHAAAAPPVTVTPGFRTGMEAIAVAYAHHVQPLIAMLGRMRWAETVLDETGETPDAPRRRTAEGLLAIDAAFAAAAIDDIERLFRVEGPVLERDPAGRQRLGSFALVYRGALFDARLHHRDGVLSAQVVDAASGFARDLDPAETAAAWFGAPAGESR